MRRLALFVGLFALGKAAPLDRITAPIDNTRWHALGGHIHPLAQPQFDRGAIDPTSAINDVTIVFKMTPQQQTELDALLVDQQNPSSPQFHKWLTPEDFGDRFGLTIADQNKVAAWLRSEGLLVNRLARGRNRISFSGTAAQLSKTLHTSFHRFQIGAEAHRAIVSEPSIPEAIAGVVAGFTGLNDFGLKPAIREAAPEDTLGDGEHRISPQDYATIYNFAPLHQAGIDGTGVGIAIVGESNILLGDYRAFRGTFGLPQVDPKVVLYNGTDPGDVGGGRESEAVLDLEWAGAVAPGATIYYILGPSAYDAMVYAIDQNIAQVISASYGACEPFFAQDYYRPAFQQGNAQGITILSSSGDAGAAGCNEQFTDIFGTRGRVVNFPSVMAEVTGVGGTEFNEGSGNYWNSINSTSLMSAFSYIPEMAWNDSGPEGLAATGGGASLYTPKPSWQAGPGVPDDGQRDVPDVALTAAGHDPYLIYMHGSLGYNFGTSASAPSMAGIVALINHYQVAHGYQQQPGLGNINPQLYRLAQTAPGVFHDITVGSNIVLCQPGTPDCLTGSYGFATGPGYDQATGLGSIDANALASQWNKAASAVVVTLQPSATSVTVNDTVTVAVTVAAAGSPGIPTGRVDFAGNGVALGSATLVAGSGNATASISLPVYLLGLGNVTVGAQYSGDAAFSAGGSIFTLQVSSARGAAGIVVTANAPVYPFVSAANTLVWQAQINLRETGGVRATITDYSLDGHPQPLSQLSSTVIPASRELELTLTLLNLAAPVTKVFAFSGTDDTGHSWTRQIPLLFIPLYPYAHFNLTASPAVIMQNPTADPSCQWQTQINIDEMGGYPVVLTDLSIDGVSQASQIASIFGTTRLDAWATLMGTICFNSTTSLGAHTLSVTTFNKTQLNLTLVSPPQNPATLSVSPGNVAMANANGPAQAVLSISLSDANQTWTASVFPNNNTTSWLTLSQLSGSGAAQINLQADGSALEAGVYRAMIVIQSQNATPQFWSVPVMFINGPTSSGMNISTATNAFSYQPSASPGMLLSVFGSQLANSTAANTNTVVYSLAGVSATINGIPAPIQFVSPGQVNLQIPYSVGAGPSAVGINNNGQVAGFQFQLAPAAPGILTDGSGNAIAIDTISRATGASILLTGAGDVSPAYPIGIDEPFFFSTQAQNPILSVAVTVGGITVPVQIANRVAAGIIEVNFALPASIPSGAQPAVVTIGSTSSPPANLNVP